MSASRSHGERGLAESHMLDRFSTTYSASYRPFEERTVPIHCIPGSSVLDGNVGSTLPFRSSRADKVIYNTSPPLLSNSTTGGMHSNYRPLTHHIQSNYGHVSDVSVRRPLDDVQPNTSKQRPMPGMSVMGSAFNRSFISGGDPPTGKASYPFVAGSSNKNYTSTYTTTVVSDKLTPCYALSRDTNCDKAVQAKPTYCTPQPRTLSTINPTVKCNPKSNLNDQFLTGNTKNSIDNRVTVTPTSPYYFDFGQMFSQVAKINDHLYLSSLNALSPDRLRQHGITLLVSAMIDSPPSQLRNAVLNSMHVVVEDMEGANLRAHFDRVGERIAAENRRGGRTLVHCMAGVSRSSSLILAYMMRHLNMSLADAYQHVRSIRPCIQPNPSFWRQLLDYEEHLRGSRSVRLLPPVGYSGSCGISSTGRLYANQRAPPRTSYLDLYSRPTAELLPYRPLTSLHSIDSGKPYIGCRQPLG